MTLIGTFFKLGEKLYTNRAVGRQRQPYILMTILTLFLFGGIGYRLFSLQIAQGQEYNQKAENNRIRIIPKAPVRGDILDRHGKVLASTRFSHSAYIWPRVQKQPQWPKVRYLLAKILGISVSEIQKQVEEAGYDSTTLIRIARHLTPAQITAIEEHRNQLTGVEIDTETVRYYPNGEVAAHVLGYTGELTPEQLKKRKHLGYRLGDVVGKMGVEQAFEQQLRGEWGGLQLEVDGSGRVMKVLGQKVAQYGKDVRLTIDLELQKTAEAALGQHKGAIVALNPTNGEVLAMASYPRFDPNIFSSQVTPNIWKKLQGQDHPFLNRALRGFPPASTFKVVTATAGMESGKFPPSTILPTYAYLRVGGTAFGEWNRAGFGPMGYVRAMAWSSNTFHGQIGNGVGGETLIKWARIYGFGEETGIELQETPGLIADDAWKRKYYDIKWNSGDNVNMSIGQGFTLATPLQVAVMFAVPANGGYRVKPHMLKGDGNSSQWRTSLKLKPSTIRTLRQALRSVVAEGTGKAVKVPELPPVAGKSGTAEAAPGKTHTWFGAFAPFEKPEIVVVGFGEHTGGGGGSVAAPMVRQVMETYFSSKHKSPNK